MSDKPGKCTNEKCNLFGKDLESCGCTDEKHYDRQNPMNLKMVMLVTLGAALVLAGATLLMKSKSPNLDLPGPGPVVCTADAMQCPDGSWVGRTGPNCEFVCPGEY